MATPEEIQQQIDTLEADLEAARIAAQAAANRIAELEAEQVAADVVAPAPVITPQPSISQRILPKSQFYQGQQGCDK